MGILDKFSGGTLAPLPAGIHSAKIKSVDFFKTKKHHTLFRLVLITEKKYSDSIKRWAITCLLPEMAEEINQTRRELALLNMWKALADSTGIDTEYFEENLLFIPSIPKREEWVSHISTIDTDVLIGKPFYFKFTPYKKSTVALDPRWEESLRMEYSRNIQDKGFLRNVAQDHKATSATVYRHRNGYRVNLLWAEKLSVLPKWRYDEILNPKETEPKLTLVENKDQQEIEALRKLEAKRKSHAITKPLEGVWKDILG